MAFPKKQNMYGRRDILAAATGSAVLAGSSLAVASEKEQCSCGSAAVEELLSKQEISEVLYRYPRAIGRHDSELLTSLAHPDATVKFKTSVFPSWTVYVAWLINAHDAMLANNYRITNILIEVNGDVAASEASGTATLLLNKDGNTVEERWMHTRYLDKWERRDGRWAIASRQTLIDYRRIETFPAAELATRYPIVGEEHDEEDPSYAHFESIRDQN